MNDTTIIFLGSTERFGAGRPAGPDVGGEAQRRMRRLLDLGAQHKAFERGHFSAALEHLAAESPN